LKEDVLKQLLNNSKSVDELKEQSWIANRITEREVAQRSR